MRVCGLRVLSLFSQAPIGAVADKVVAKMLRVTWQSDSTMPTLHQPCCSGSAAGASARRAPRTWRFGTRTRPRR